MHAHQRNQTQIRLQTDINRHRISNSIIRINVAMEQKFSYNNDKSIGRIISCVRACTLDSEVAWFSSLFSAHSPSPSSLSLLIHKRKLSVCSQSYIHHCIDIYAYTKVRNCIVFTSKRTLALARRFYERAWQIRAVQKSDTHLFHLQHTHWVIVLE